MLHLLPGHRFYRQVLYEKSGPFFRYTDRNLTGELQKVR